LLLFVAHYSSLSVAANQTDSAIGTAQAIVKQTGVRRGVCGVVTNSGQDRLPIELARASELLVHVRCADHDSVARLQAMAEEAGLGIDRLVVEYGGADPLPYADNMLDILVVPRGSNSDGVLPKHLEMLRVLQPRGTGFVAGKESLEQLRTSAHKSDGLERVILGASTWSKFSKPPLEGAGNWSHWEHGPDNNPVSEDTIIKAPYLTQFLAKPYYIAMPSITTAAGGRTFLAIGHIAHHRREWGMMNKIIARNGYNGTVLWERKLPDGYLVHRSAFIATEDAFYMVDGDHATVLDPQTGTEQDTIRLSGVSGDWKWMVMKDDVLFVLAGNKDPGVQSMKGDRSFGGWSWADLSEGYYSRPRVPWGMGHTLAAYDLKKQKLIWIYNAKKPIDSRGLSMGEDRISVYSPDLHFRALDLKTGEVLWTNSQEDVLDLVEQPGQGLTSTPGFRTACLVLFTPDALIIQGQTRNNVVALSTKSGSLLWTKSKITNNPNAIYLDGTVILGIGKGGTHVALDPVSGEIVKEFNFKKRACTRLTACSDSLFVRGEGTLRFDRETERVIIDGAARPACNDGALPANGLLYLGPWQCDCNLSLIGRLARCSAGDFRFDYEVIEKDRLQVTENPQVAVLPIIDRDWPTYRADNDRSSSTIVKIHSKVQLRWQYSSSSREIPAPSTAAGDLIFTAGEDGQVKALNAKNGKVVWTYKTAGPIRYSPTIDNDRVYVGSGDGRAYCLEARTGRELWRFRAAPVERHLMLYGKMSSTWPVNSGVLVNNGVAYFAAGIIDSDGTYVYAVDAVSGEIVWQNNSSGHLNTEIRKGVSVQGNLTLAGNRLLLAGGNQVSPAPFSIDTGECLAKPMAQGQPKANNGRFAGRFVGKFDLVGGRILFSAPENVSTKGSFQLRSPKHGNLTLNFGGIPPAWDRETVALVNFQHGKLTCLDAAKVTARLEKEFDPNDAVLDRRRRFSLSQAFQADGSVRWTTDLGESDKFEVVSLVVAPNAIVAVVRQQQKARAQSQWYVVALNKTNGNLIWRQEVRQDPLPDGLMVDRSGQVIVTMINGNLICFGGVL
jgi:outer membrane protein assembly factor BamB